LTLCLYTLSSTEGNLISKWDIIFYYNFLIWNKKNKKSPLHKLKCTKFYIINIFKKMADCNHRTHIPSHSSWSKHVFFRNQGQDSRMVKSHKVRKWTWPSFYGPGPWVSISNDLLQGNLICWAETKCMTYR
jgi:hypothetical protein